MATAELKLGQSIAVNLLSRLAEYSYSNGDFSHKPECSYIESEDIRDCDCGLMKLGRDIAWLVAQVQHGD